MGSRRVGGGGGGEVRLVKFSSRKKFFSSAPLVFAGFF